MTTGKSDLIDVTLHYRQDNPAGTASAFWQGEYDTSAQGRKRERWIWLAKSLIEVVHMNDDVVEVTLPQWLAEQKELI